MKTNIKNIDQVFVEGIDSMYNDVPASYGWRRIKTRMLFHSVYRAKITKVSFVVLLSIILLVPVSVYFYSSFLSSLLSHTNKEKVKFGNTSTNKQIIAKDIINIRTEEEQAKVYQTVNQFISIPVVSSPTAQLKKSGQNINLPVLKKRHESQTNKNEVIASIPARSVTTIFSSDQEFNLADNQLQYMTTDRLVVNGLENDSKLFLGFEAGPDISIQYESLQNLPSFLFNGGLTLKYDAEKLFLKAALNMAYFEIVNQYNYYTDSLAGQLVSSGFEIIPVVSDDGDTTWSKVYNDRFTNIYDTVLSGEQINMTSFKTVISIPFSIGKAIYKTNRFNVSVFGGARFNIFMNKEQSVPEYASNDQQIIQLERNVTNTVLGQLYLQVGFLLGFKVSDKAIVSFESSYNHGFNLWESEHYSIMKSYISIRAGLLFKL